MKVMKALIMTQDIWHASDPMLFISVASLAACYGMLRYSLSIQGEQLRAGYLAFVPLPYFLRHDPICKNMHDATGKSFAQRLGLGFRGRSLLD